MYQLISDLNRKEGVTIIMVSHDLSAALQYATHILHVGAHVWFGTRDDYLQSKVGSSFLKQGGMPE
jgi:zinc transport system ATP-binding protein